MEKRALKSGRLLESLCTLFPDQSHKKIKNALKNGAVLVNGKVRTKYDYPVHPQDKIEIQKEYKTHKKSPLKIIYEDQNFLVVEKPAHLLTIATDKEKEKTVYHKMREFIKKRHSKDKIFILHRLDQDTSGVLVFVKNEKIKTTLQQSWNQYVQKREYYAIVKGIPETKKNYTCYLKEDQNNFVFVTDDSKKGKKAVTSFEVIKTNGVESLLKVNIKTGRKNQIRVVLSYLGYPIVGDKKYGGPKADRLYLQASKLKLKGEDHKTYCFETPIEASFLQRLKKKGKSE